MHPLRLVAIALLLAAPAADAAIVKIKWSAHNSFTHKGTIAPRGVVEICGKLAAATRIRWDYEASLPLEFNVHYHEGKAVTYPAKLSAVASARDTLDVKAPQEYCWMLTNTGTDPATYSVVLDRSGV
jgi:hypothetical protein